MERKIEDVIRVEKLQVIKIRTLIHYRGLYLEAFLLFPASNIIWGESRRRTATGSPRDLNQEGDYDKNTIYIRAKNANDTR